MKKLSIVFISTLILGLMSENVFARAIDYSKDFLEYDVLRGCSKSLKVFNNEITLIPMETFDVSIWLNDPRGLIGGDMWYSFPNEVRLKVFNDEWMLIPAETFDIDIRLHDPPKLIGVDKGYNFLSKETSNKIRKEVLYNKVLSDSRDEDKNMKSFDGLYVNLGTSSGSVDRFGLTFTASKLDLIYKEGKDGYFKGMKYSIGLSYKF